MQPKLKYTRSEQAHSIWMQGDKDIQIEPPEVRLHFPGGSVSVTRCSDGMYWIHANLLDVKNPDDGNMVQMGRVIDARIDCDGMQTNEGNIGDLKNPKLQHFAIKIQPI